MPVAFAGSTLASTRRCFALHPPHLTAKARTMDELVGHTGRKGDAAAWVLMYLGFAD